VIAAFHAMIRKKAEAKLDTWIEWAKAGLVASFANSVVKDRAPFTPRSCRRGPTGKPRGRSQS
jgi:hypothetical protein